MAFFKLDINSVSNSVERHTKYSNSLKDNIGLVYNSLIDADSYWNDSNTSNFISKVKSDGYNINDCIIYVDNIYKEVSYFCDSIKSVCSKYGYKNIRTISFNDGRISKCINYINQAIEILNINLVRLKNLKKNIEYVSLSSVNEKIYKITKIVNLLENIKSDIIKFCDDINECVINSKIRKGRIEKNELNVSLVKYNWNITKDEYGLHKTNVGNDIKKS